MSWRKVSCKFNNGHLRVRFPGEPSREDVIEAISDRWGMQSRPVNRITVRGGIRKGRRVTPVVVTHDIHIVTTRASESAVIADSFLREYERVKNK